MPFWPDHARSGPQDCDRSNCILSLFRHDWPDIEISSEWVEARPSSIPLIPHDKPMDGKMAAQHIRGGGGPAWSWERQRGKAGNGVEDRKEETMERTEEQRACYTRAKWRGDALPDRAGVNPKGQRTGSVSIHAVQVRAHCVWAESCKKEKCL